MGCPIERATDAVGKEQLNAPLACRRLAEHLAGNEQYDDAARVYQKAFRYDGRFSRSTSLSRLVGALMAPTILPMWAT